MICSTDFYIICKRLCSIFLSQYQKFSLVNTLVFQKILGMEIFFAKKGISLFSVEIFSSHSAEKFRRGTLLCFEKNLVSKIVMHRGGHHGLVEFFCLTVPKEFRGEPFNVSENSVYRKILCIIGWYHDFPWKLFSLTVPKKFVGNPLVFQRISGSKNIYA